MAAHRLMRFALGALLWLFSCQAVLACTLNRGQHVTLAAYAMDPDVLVWDTAQRLINYAAGNYKVQEALRHTLLVGPGTRAVVVFCRVSPARPKYMNVSPDLLGIRLLDGRHRGYRGWVLSNDVRASESRRPAGSLR